MDKNLLMHRVLTGAASQVERMELDEWLTSSPENMQDFEDMKILYSPAEPNPEDTSVGGNDAWAKLQLRISLLTKRKKRLRLIRMSLISIGIYAFVLFTFTLIDTNNGEVNALTSTIHFNNAPISEVLKVINVKDRFVVTLDSVELTSCSFTGSFKRGTTFKKVLEILAKAKNLKIHLTSEQSAILSGSECDF